MACREEKIMGAVEVYLVWLGNWLKKLCFRLQGLVDGIEIDFNSLTNSG